MAELNEVLEGGDTFSTINPKIIEEASRIISTTLDAGFQGWGKSFSKEVMFQIGNVTYNYPAQCLEDANTTLVITAVSWGGERQGKFYIAVPENGACCAIALFLAVALGMAPDLDHTKLDHDGMDAYSELASAMVQQGAQSLRGVLPGKIEWTVETNQAVVGRNGELTALLGSEEILCGEGQLTIEGQPSFPVYMLMTVSCTGMTVAVPEKAQTAAGSGADAEKLKSLAKLKPRYRNETLAMKLKVPVIVELAKTRKRVSDIQKWAPGAVIEFHTRSGEFLKIKAGNTKIADGEVGTVNQHFGVLIRHMLPQMPYVSALKKFS
jgi:flagellar motor switch/type III secretory pathway protein FliN